MKNLFETFKSKVLSSLSIGEDEKEKEVVNNLIALGVLLWSVAEADDKFLPKEEEKIKDVLKEYEDISDEDMPIVMRAILEASIDRIDIFTFTRDAAEGLSKDDKVNIVEDLFRVACIDHELDELEHEAIRQISLIFRLDHQEFIDTKIKIKKEFGMDTAGL